MDKIPRDIIINNIIPYTYSIQTEELLNDIKSFLITKDKIIEFYLFDYNYRILYVDLCLFLVNENINIPYISSFVSVVEYNYNILKKNGIKLSYSFIVNKMITKLKISEREKFIKNYIEIYD